MKGKVGTTLIPNPTSSKPFQLRFRPPLDTDNFSTGIHNVIHLAYMHNLMAPGQELCLVLAADASMRRRLRCKMHSVLLYRYRNLPKVLPPVGTNPPEMRYRKYTYTLILSRASHSVPSKLLEGYFCSLSIDEHHNWSHNHRFVLNRTAVSLASAGNSIPLIYLLCRRSSF